MKRFIIVFSLILSLFLNFGFAGPQDQGKPGKLLVRQTFMEQVVGKFSPQDYVNKQRETFNRLKAEAAALSPERIVTIHVTDEEIADIDDYKCATCQQDALAYKLRVGIVKAVDLKVFLANDLESLHRTTDGSWVWTAAIMSEKASGLRVHFTDIALPQGAELYVYNDNNQAFGPYSRTNGDFWTNTVTGPLAYVQVKFPVDVPMEAVKKSSFSIGNVGHLGKKFLLPYLQQDPSLPEEVSRTNQFCSGNASCVVDASCYSTSDWAQINNVKNAIAHMQFVEGFYLYYCSGGLLNDTDSTTQIPYFLTANHCISTQSVANNLECYWQYSTASCGSACYNPVGAVPRTLGATLLSTSTTSDYTLMQLSQAPPSGSVLMGWNATAVANTNNYELYRISHPSGSPAAYSKHRVDTSSPTCSGMPRGSWIYSKDVVGATEGGSSGSPVCNVSGQVVGQLTGACGYNTNDPCDTTNNWTTDGAFANYYASISSWLDPSTGPSSSYTHVHNIALSISSSWFRTTCTATVTVRDENGNLVSGATVYGTFSGGISGSTSATTNTSGVATLSVSKWFSSVSSFQFCVTNITHATMTYDSSANVETCDTY